MLKRLNVLVALMAILGAFCLTACSTTQVSSANMFPVYWPPKMNERYPDLNLMSTKGNKVQLSSFLGKTLLIEPIGMSCPACQAFAGANRPGMQAFGGVTPQSNLRSIDELLAERGISLDNPDLVYIQLLLFNMNMKTPSLQEAQAWAKNFNADRLPNRIVLIGEGNIAGQASYNLIPGFQLVDKSFYMRSDSTGHNPRNDLYTHLMPMLKNLLAEGFICVQW